MGRREKEEAEGEGGREGRKERGWREKEVAEEGEREISKGDSRIGVNYLI